MRRGGQLSYGARDVRQPPPQTPIIELVEVEMTVERGRLIVHRVNDHRSRAELAASAHTATQRIDKQIPAERLALLGAWMALRVEATRLAVQREPRERHDRNRAAKYRSPRHTFQPLRP